MASPPTDLGFATAEEFDDAEFDSGGPTYAEAFADPDSPQSEKAHQHADQTTATIRGVIATAREAENVIRTARRAGLNRRRIARLPIRAARRLVAARAHRRPAGRAPRPAANPRTRGSRRATGSSPASPSDDPDEHDLGRVQAPASSARWER
jgi:hypothetical protein